MTATNELSPCGHPKSSMMTGTTYTTSTGEGSKTETGTFSYCGDCASIMTPFSYSEPKQSGYWAIDENPSRLRRWLMWVLLGWKWREL